MTIKEFAAKVIEAALEHGQGFDMYGYRFVNHQYAIGEELTEVSRSNHNREDARDFPEYNTEEYWEMEELDGLSAYSIDRYDIKEKNADAIEYEIFRHAGRRRQRDSDMDFFPIADYCYLLGADDASWGEDEGEIIMEYPTVLARII